MNIVGQFLLFIGLALFIAWGIWRLSKKEKEEEEGKVEEEKEQDRKNIYVVNLKTTFQN